MLACYFSQRKKYISFMSSGSFTFFESVSMSQIAFGFSNKAPFVGAFHGFSRGALAFEKQKLAYNLIFNGLFAAFLKQLGLLRSSLKVAS